MSWHELRRARYLIYVLPNNTIARSSRKPARQNHPKLQSQASIADIIIGLSNPWNLGIVDVEPWPQSLASHRVKSLVESNKCHRAIGSYGLRVLES